MIFTWYKTNSRALRVKANCGKYCVKFVYASMDVLTVTTCYRMSCLVTQSDTGSKVCKHSSKLVMWIGGKMYSSQTEVDFKPNCKIYVAVL